MSTLFQSIHELVPETSSAYRFVGVIRMFIGIWVLLLVYVYISIKKHTTLPINTGLYVFNSIQVQSGPICGCPICRLSPFCTILAPSYNLFA